VRWNDCDSRFVSCGKGKSYRSRLPLFAVTLWRLSHYSKDNLVILWDPTYRSPLRVMRGHINTVYAAMFSNVLFTNESGVAQKQSVIVSAGMDPMVSDYGEVIGTSDLVIMTGMLQIRMWSADEDNEGDFLGEFPSGTNRYCSCKYALAQAVCSRPNDDVVGR
jgi:hypothetical protein